MLFDVFGLFLVVFSGLLVVFSGFSVIFFLVVFSIVFFCRFRIWWRFWGHQNEDPAQQPKGWLA